MSERAGTSNGLLAQTAKQHGGQTKAPKPRKSRTNYCEATWRPLALTDMGKHSSSSKDRKKAKKAKKKRKEQKHDDNNHNGTIDRQKEKIHEADAATELEAAAPPSVVPQVQVAVTVPLATNLSGDDGSNEPAPSKSGWSWGQAFDAAAQIRPNEDDLDEDFLRRTANGGDGDDNDQRGDGGGLATIAGMINDTSTKSHAGEPSEPMPESTETTTHKSKKDRTRKSQRRNGRRNQTMKLSIKTTTTTMIRSETSKREGGPAIYQHLSTRRIPTHQRLLLPSRDEWCQVILSILPRNL